MAKDKSVHEESGLIALLAIIVVVLITFLALFISWKANHVDKNEEVSNNSTNKQESQIEKTVKDKFYETYLFLTSANAYCNDSKHDSSNNKIDGNYNGFYESTQFNSYEELQNYLKDLMSEDIIQSAKWNGEEYYTEKDGKLYCADLGKGGIYDYSVSNIEVISDTDSEIKAIATMELSSLSMEESLFEEFDLTLQKNENNWIISSYVRR